MAIRTIGKIVLYESMNQDKIDAMLFSSDTIVFEIERRYALGEVPELLGAVLPVQFDDVSINYIEALKNVIDASSYIHEENAIVFDVQYTELTKTFDLTSSYVRDVRDTSGALTPVTVGQILLAVFITPGLSKPARTMIELPYGQAVSVGDELLLRQAGIALAASSTGSSLVVDSSSVPYQVEFIRPELSLENYVIQFNYKNKTIEL